MAATAGSNRRVFEPDSPSDWINVPVGKHRGVDRSLLLAKIKAFYREAERSLLVKVRPATPALFLHAGCCFGFLDPVSNIVVNTLSVPVGSVVVQQQQATLLKKGGLVDGKRLRDVENRSLDGLVTFLTCFFPYLENWEAVRYLLLADADPLVAARIVVHDRGLKRFDFDSGATVAAVRMLAAKHAEPDQLVGAWMSLSPRLDQHAVSELSAAGLLTKLVLSSMSPPDAPDPMRRYWELAACRLRGRGDDVCGNAASYQHRRSLRRALLDTIHGFYLRALARLPAGELRSRYHRSLLDAGHCYGPMEDPVSNILLNTVWYDAAGFPPTTEEFDTDNSAATAQRLLRIAARSLYGLASFLCTRYSELDLPDAIRCLLSADGALGAAATEAERQGQRPRGTLQEAYAATAAAAWHPQPDAQVQRLNSCSADTICTAASSLLQNGRQLSSQELMSLRSLLTSSNSDEPPQHPAAGMPPPPPTKDCKIYTKVKAALRRYALQEREDPLAYKIHVICGVNERVSGPEVRLKKKWHGCNPYTHYYYRTHVNFLASAAGAGDDGAAPDPVLFFAELSNGHDDEDVMCCPVCVPPPCAGQLPRCLYCDHEASRIVHPAVEDFHGRELEFEKMVCREDLFDDEFDPDHEDQHFTNYKIIDQSEYIAEWVEERCHYDDQNDCCGCDD